MQKTVGDEMTIETEPKVYPTITEAEIDAEQLQKGDNGWDYEVIEDDEKIRIKIIDENGEFVGWW